MSAGSSDHCSDATRVKIVALASAPSSSLGRQAARRARAREITADQTPEMSSLAIMWSWAGSEALRCDHSGPAFVPFPREAVAPCPRGRHLSSCSLGLARSGSLHGRQAHVLLLALRPLTPRRHRAAGGQVWLARHHLLRRCPVFSGSGRPSLSSRSVIHLASHRRGVLSEVEGRVLRILQGPVATLVYVTSGQALRGTET